MRPRILTLIAVVAIAACGSQPPTPQVSVTAKQTPIGQLPDIDIDAVLAHTKVLSSDKYEGRAPGTNGEELTVAYLTDQFKKAGLKPGNTDGTYVQKVPLVGITPDPKTSLLFRNTSPSAASGTAARRLKFKDDVVAWTKHGAGHGSLGNREGGRRGTRLI